MNKLIIVINGRGGCGKDTLCEIASKYYRVKNVSSITPIKKLASAAGWNGEKDPKSRKMLSDLKRLFTDYNDLCSNYVLSEADSFLRSDDEIMFVHIRESSEIIKFISAAKEKCACISLLVNRHTENYDNSALGNASDDMVADFDYDFCYENNATDLIELENSFISYLRNILAHAQADHSKEDYI